MLNIAAALTKLIPGATAASEVSGVYRVMVNGSVREATSSEVLAATKTEHIAANRAEARRRIEGKWPDPIQRSAAMGIYPAEKIEQMKIDIAAVIEAENNAADQIDAATTVAEVGAVTPAWPNI